MFNIPSRVIDYHHPVKTPEFPHFYPLVVSEVFFVAHFINSNYRFKTLLAITNRVINEEITVYC